MFELFRQTFTLESETFAKKSILSANKFVTLQVIYALYVRVKTFPKTIAFYHEILRRKHLAFNIFYIKCS